jgi:hypothetical protein
MYSHINLTKVCQIFYVQGVLLLLLTTSFSSTGKSLNHAIKGRNVIEKQNIATFRQLECYFYCTFNPEKGKIVRDFLCDVDISFWGRKELCSPYVQFTENSTKHNMEGKLFFSIINSFPFSAMSTFIIIFEKKDSPFSCTHLSSCNFFFFFIFG